ncbi:MAG: DUF4340 domain-containing protein [Ruminococcus sp.]|nr:DUF4340 domain-containing protein [Ruminococcus sp.]
MKKGIIAVISLAAAAAISTGAFVYVQNSDKKDKEKKSKELAENQLFDIDSDSIGMIEIKSAEGSYTLRLDGDRWVNAPDSGNTFHIAQSKAQLICTTICDLEADTNYGEADSESKEKYGLNDPYVLTVSDGNQDYTINIGDASPTGNYYYAMVDGKNKIYAVEATEVTSLLTTRFDLIDSSIVPYSDEEISGIAVKRGGKTAFELTRNLNTGLWELPEEYSLLTVNQTRPSTMVTVLARLSAAQLVEENVTDLSQYGLDDPYAELTVSGTDGTSHTLILSRYGREASKMTHVLIKDTGLLGLYYTSDLDFVDYDIYDIIMQNVESANMYRITEFSFSCDEAEDTFTLDATADTAECRGTPIDLAKAEIKNMFTAFYNSFSYISITDTDIEAAPELADPVLSARYVFEGGEESQVDLVSTGEGSDCYVFVDGKYTGTITSSDFISGNSSMMSEYKTLCELAGLEPNLK